MPLSRAFSMIWPSPTREATLIAPPWPQASLSAERSGDWKCPFGTVVSTD
jgi:hypothetical protein